MNRSTDRILTTHVGSLVRPRPILEAMKAEDTGVPWERARFNQEVSNAVRDVVKEQATVGIDIPSDGEFGRPGFMNYINRRLAGIERRPLESEERAWGRGRERQVFPEFYEVYDRHYRTLWMHPEVSIDDVPLPGNFDRFRVTGPIKYCGHEELREEISRFKAALAGHNFADAFLPVMHPSDRPHRDFMNFYPTEEAYRFALADAFHEEYKAITDAGLVLQVDYPNIQSPGWMYSSRNDKKEMLKSVHLGVEAVNHALRDIPEDRIRVHFCWGSNNDPHTTDPTLREVLPLLLSVKGQAYSIEAANPRHEHEWMVWKDVKLPDGKILIPGIISHQTNVVEHPELVAWRIRNFASVVGKENVIAGTDCGFSQFWDSIRVHPTVQWAKLKSLVEGAQLASKQLWN